ncbi:MAG: hypothetical protein VX961_01990, partial [Verrucomicrobiota bacterium]|nr:hypothetical protein [Verrucomicrobiota bacterium]
MDVFAYEKEATTDKNLKTTSKPNIIVVKDDTSAKRWKIENKAVVQMVTEGLLRLTNQSNINAAWLSLISPEDTIGIKVNAGPGR